MVELQKFLLLNKFVVQFFEVLGLSRIFSLYQLYESALELSRCFLDVFKRVDGELSDPHLVAL